MTISKEFIQKPILTIVISVLILLGGLISLQQITIESIPSVAPPTIKIKAQWPGASAETIEQAITIPLEQAVNGVENLDYIRSGSMQGSSEIALYFKNGTDNNINQVNVTNKANKALAQLPAEVRNDSGVSVEKSNDDSLAVLAVIAKNDNYDMIFLTELMQKYLKDELTQVDGIVKPLQLYPDAVSYNIYFNQEEIDNLKIDSQDIVTSIRQQNIIYSLGAVGDLPSPKGQRYRYQLKVDSLITDKEEFENIVIRTTQNAGVIRLKDIATVKYELNNPLQKFQTNKQGEKTAFIVIQQEPGSNAIEVMEQVNQVISNFKEKIPDDIEIVKVTDGTEFINESLKETSIALIEAVILVIMILFVFLKGNWRPTIVTGITIPISLIGTLIFVKLLGYSLNQLTLLGIVISVGLVVDDAIVVVEKITSNIETDMQPKEAAIQAMNELFGAIIATSLVLISVFIPIAINSDATGIIARQFASTIIFTIVISTFNAISLTPMLSSRIIRNETANTKGPCYTNIILFSLLIAIWCNVKFGAESSIIGLIVGGLIGNYINKAAALTTIIYKKFERIYESNINLTLKAKNIIIISVIVALTLTIIIVPRYPSEFIPLSDRGYVYGITLLNSNSPGVQAEKIGNQVQTVINEEKEVREAAIIYLSPTEILSYISFYPIKERTDQTTSSKNISQRLQQALDQKIAGATSFIYPPPAVPGFNPGFEFQFTDQKGNASFTELNRSAQEFIQEILKTGKLGYARESTKMTTELNIKINRAIVGALDIDYKRILQSISNMTSRNYIDKTYKGTQSYNIYMTSEGKSRSKIEDIESLMVTSRNNKRYPLSMMATITMEDEPTIISHYNLKRAINIMGSVKSGINEMKVYDTIRIKLKEKMSRNFGGEFTGLARVAINSKGKQAIIIILALLTAYLVLSAQYESFYSPLIIMITVPIAALGAIGLLWIKGSVALDIFGQIGIIALIGLAAKNSILIVERADQIYAEGSNEIDAVKKSARERLRPILMTTISSLAGFYPLVVANGAGAIFRNSIGTVVFGGVLISSIISLYTVPAIYITVKRLEHKLGVK